MGAARAFLRGIGIGAGLMYLFDPNRGKRRRALLRDQLVSCLNRTEDFLDVVSRDVNNRWHGVVAEVQAALSSDTASDRVIAERVRAKMGRYVSHPRAIHVAANQGRVTVSGPILADEAEDFLAALWSVRGVKEVINQLDVHQEPGDVSALQGGAARPGCRLDVMQENWSPTTRLAAGAAGFGLMLNCLLRRTPMSVLLGTAGFGLFMRATTNLETKRLVGATTGRRNIEIQKTAHIAAPVERVFEFITDVKQFSRFLPNVKEVRELSDGRIRWTAAGPAGADIHLEEFVTELIPNKLLAWESAPGNVVGYEGSVRVEPDGEGGSRVDVKMSYNPPGGAAAHALATLFGVDPASEMERGLARIKTFLETGKTPYDVAQSAEN